MNNAETIWNQVIEAIALLGGLGGLAAIVDRFMSKRKLDAEAKKTAAEANQLEKDAPIEHASKIVDASGDLIDQYKKLLADYQQTTDAKILDLKNEVEESKKVIERVMRRISYLMNGIQVLIGQLVDAGQTPCWKPNDWTPDGHENQKG